MSGTDHLEEMVPIEEAARLLGTSEQQVQVMIHDGLLTTNEVSGEARVRRAEVLAVSEMGG